MKNLILSFSFVLVSIFTLSAKDMTGLANTYGETILGLDLSKWNSSKVNVLLIDALDQVLVTENFEQGSKKTRLYNLKNLSDGNYTLRVEDKQKIASQSVEISNGVVFVEENIAYTYKANFKVEGSSVKVNLLALGNNVTVSIIDQDNVLVYEDKMGAQNSISKKYTLTNLPSGRYSILVESGLNTEVQEINL